MAHNSFYGDDSPIAAFATAAGNSALTLIRCSGKGSIELVSGVFESAGKKNKPLLKDAGGNTVTHGWIIRTGNREQRIESAEAREKEHIDEVLVSVFRSPKSYTGEDSLDICCHGGYCAGNAVISVLKNAGFRGALPGEFTFRAFMNGKIDLTRSESIMELVSAKTDAGRRRAVSRLSGSLHAGILEIKNLLVHVLAGAELYLDYSEDEISADADEAAGKLPDIDIAVNVLERLKKLSGTWLTERIYQEGITCVIAGRPNAGKSSLFNLLLSEDRSIVTEVPGTTRDWIEAWVSIDGAPVRLVDTAGLRDTNDSVEKIGVERSRLFLQEADIVLYMIDGEQGLTADDCKHSGSEHYIFIWNKCDAAEPPNPFPLAGISPVRASAKTGEGLAEIYSAVTQAISRQAGGVCVNEPVSASIGTLRQKNLVDSACSALEEALSLARRDEPLDLIAPLLRDAVNSLGEITGEVSTADILEEMFSKFCVGK